MRPLNLASQPFKNERLPSLLLTMAVVILLAVTVAHALTVRRLLPGRTSARYREVAELERESARLREETRQERAPRPDAATLSEWSMLKDLVDKRAFSWTDLFAVLEDALPDGVRLVSIAPSVVKGQMTIELSADARSYQDGLEFLAILQQRPEFTDVRPLGRDEREGGASYRYRMGYRPEVAASRPARATSPAAPEAPVPSPGAPTETEDHP